jgi:hypothetical protein
MAVVHLVLAGKIQPRFISSPASPPAPKIFHETQLLIQTTLPPVRSCPEFSLIPSPFHPPFFESPSSRLPE